MVNFKTNRAQTFIIIITFIFILSLRLLYITNSPLEYHAWRQSDTEAIARNFASNSLNIFLPQLNYDGPLPNYVQLELQLTTFIIALLYKAFGYHYALARLVPLLFFMGSAYYLFILAKSMYDLKTALYAVVLYGILPINIFFSRAIMPESAAMFFYIGSFFYFSEWIKLEAPHHFLLASIFTALAITQKIPAIFICFPMLYLAIKKHNALQRYHAVHKYIAVRNYKTVSFGKLLFIFVLISCGLPLLYFGYLHIIAETDYVSGIALELILPNFATAIFTAEAQAFLRVFFYRLFTPYSIILLLGGIYTIHFPRDSALLIWTLAIAVEIATIAAVIKLEYYLIFFSPIIALWGAKSFDFLNKKRAGSVIMVVICTLLFYTGWQNISPYYGEDTELAYQVKIIEQNTRTDHLLVIGSSVPILLNLSHRQGYRAIPGTFSSPEQELRFYIENGAKYFFPADEFFLNKAYESYRIFLDANYRRIATDSNYFFYELY